jgi:serine/threonine protein kinase
MTATARGLLDAIGQLRATSRDDVLDTALGSWSTKDWRDVLLDLPLDTDTLFTQFETSWDTLISTMNHWCLRSKERSQGPPRNDRLCGFVGAVLLTMISLQHSERRRSPSPGSAEQPQSAVDPANCEHICHRLVHDSAVQGALRELYAPFSTAVDDITFREWESVDFSTLEFHRHGTTSFILKGRVGERSRGEVKTFALKCIIYPFLRIPRISRATRDYATTYNPGERDLVHLVRVWASSESWILMDFVPGETLGERLKKESNGRRPGRLEATLPPRVSNTRTSQLRIDLIEKFGKELFLALADLEKLGIQHSDLTPGNIMVTTTDDRDTLRLIDLGVNYLHLRNMPGLDGSDAAFVAPEVRAIREPADTEGRVNAHGAGTKGPPKEDLYSVGQLLVYLGCGCPDPSGRVPDIFYADAPLIARFIEDLLDREPKNRLLILGSPDGAADSLYAWLWDYLAEEIETVKAVQSEKIITHRTRWLSDFAAILQPLAGALSRRLRLWQVRRKQNLYRDAKQKILVLWLFCWSTLSAAICAVTSTLVVMWTLRNTHRAMNSQAVLAAQKTFGASSDWFPVLDRLRVTGYEIPPGATPLALGLLGLSFTLVGVKYYQSLFADITPMLVGWRAGRLSIHALGVEIGMRIWTVLPIVLIPTALLVQPQWWLLCSAIGMTLVTVSNLLASSFGRTAVSTAREVGLSTVPERVSGIDTYLSWMPGNVLWAAFQWGVGILLYAGAIQDTMVYIIVVGVMNMLQLYGIKCGIQGPDVRAGLVRACIVAERLKYVLP